MADDRSRVQVNYKSGHSMIIECDDFTIKVNRIDGRKSIEWDNAQPRPMLLGVEYIESVWELTFPEEEDT